MVRKSLIPRTASCKILLLILAAITQLFAAGVAETASLKEIREKFHSFFLEHYPSGLFDTADSYFLEPFLSGFNDMYIVIGDSWYIETALRNVENVIAKARDIDGDGYLEWVGGNSPWDHDKNPRTPARASCLYSERGVREFARLVRLIKTDNELDRSYGSRADAVLTFIKRDIINHPYCKERFAPELHTVHHIVSHHAYILLQLYLLEGDKVYMDGHEWTYLKTVQKRAEQLKESLFPQPTNPKTLMWGAVSCHKLDTSYPECYTVNVPGVPSCEDGFGNRYCSPADVSHAENFVHAAIALQRAGIVFTENDIDRIAATFLQMVWNQNPINPKFYDFIDGRLEAPGGKYGQWRMGGSVFRGAGWASLGATDILVHEVLETAEGTELSNGRLQTGFYGALARNLVLHELPEKNSPSPAN
jgi:hypothetical protein